VHQFAPAAVSISRRGLGNLGCSDGVGFADRYLAHMVFTLVVIGLVLVFVIGAIAWKTMKGRSSQG
jgi:hypothetical protein